MRALACAPARRRPPAPLTLAAAACLLAGASTSPRAAPDLDAPASEGRLLVLNKADGTLMAFDEPSHTLLATVKVGSQPHEVTPTPDGRKAYVSLVGDKSLAVVDLETWRLVRTLRPGGLDYPHGLGITPDGRRLLVTSEGSRRLFLFDAVRDVLTTTLTTTQQGTHMVAILPGGKRAFLANRGSDSVTIVSLPALRIVKNVKVGPGPEGIAATANGRWVLVALQGSGQLTVLDAEGGHPVARLPAGQIPIRVASTPNSLLSLVTNRGSNDVTVLDIVGRRVTRTVMVGKRPGGLVINPKGTRAYVCNNDSNTVSVISLASFEVTAQIPTGVQPDGIAFVPLREGKPGKGKPPRTPRPRPGGTS